jgi:hypothetical protein
MDNQFYSSWEVPLYRGMFVLIVSNDNDFVQSKLPEFDDRELYAHAWQANYRKRQGFFMVLNFWHPRGFLTHGAIAHEAVHIAHFILNARGVVSDFENDEPITYLVEWITERVYEALDKVNIKPHTKR